MGKLDVICVGSATFDTIASVPRIPSDDERIMATTFMSAGGGPAATAAVALARLGARVGFCGVVGDDAAGEFVREALIREGVVCDWLTTSPLMSTTQSCILASETTAGRTIVTGVAPEPDSESIPIGLSTWLHTDQTGYVATKRALRGSASAPLLSLDGGNPMIAPDLVGVEIYAPSVPALLRRYPSVATLVDAMEAAVADGARYVVATDGPRGIHVLREDNYDYVEAFDLPVTSTLGAGDVFHGALLAALLNGCDLLGAVREANAVAALSCRALDGRSAIPDRSELRAFLSSVGGGRRSEAVSKVRGESICLTQTGFWSVKCPTQT